MIFKVRDQNITVRCEANAAWRDVTFQMTIVVRFERIFRDEMAHRCEHLDAMVARVGDQNVAIRIGRHVPRILKFTQITSIPTEFQNEAAG